MAEDLFEDSLKENQFQRLSPAQLEVGNKELEMRAKARAMGASLGLGSLNEKEAFALMGVPDQAYNEDGVPLIAEALYEKVARESETAGFNPSVSGKLPSRSPYLKGAKMGRGSAFTERFRHFIETGGVARWKNCVNWHIRVNGLRDIDTADGLGTFKVSFFLDTAFWVPWWDKEHFDSQATVGTFSKFEPVLSFPEVDTELGNMLRWGKRSAEFSKNPDSRQHETQIGQNYETSVDSGKVPRGKQQQQAAGAGGGGGSQPMKRGSSFAKRRVVSVVDKGSHWPRLWRVCVSDEELKAMQKLEKKEQKQMTPSNEDPMPKGLQPRLRTLFEEMDRQREENLSEASSEGVAFVTYEIMCTHRCMFELEEFPFDFHHLKIIVRLDRKEGDPMSRSIIPTAHDKGFFVSSRVSKMVNFHLARNLDWEVTKEAMTNGGFQRLNASAIVRRSSGYYVRNYVIICFLLASSVFFNFLARPDDLNARVTINFTTVVAVVAFKSSGSHKLPLVPYSTIVSSYFLTCFYVVLGVGSVAFAFSTQCSSGGSLSGNKKRVIRSLMCTREPGRFYNLPWIPAYNPLVESAVAGLLLCSWLLFNFFKWRAVLRRVEHNIRVVDQVMIGWMVFKQKGPKKAPIGFQSEVLVHRTHHEPDAAGSSAPPAKWYLPSWFATRTGSRQTGGASSESELPNRSHLQPASSPSTPPAKGLASVKPSPVPWTPELVPPAPSKTPSPGSGSGAGGERSSFASASTANKESDVLELMQRAARQGDLSAQNSLGTLYKEGRGGVEKDDAEAAKWFKSAALKGDAAAQNSFCLMLQYGRGVPKNDEEAVKWVKKSCEQGHPDAQNNLGIRCKYGRGVAQSDELAVHYFRLAAETGHPGAMNNLGAMYKSGRGVTTQSDAEAFRWQKRAADAGDPDGQNNLGILYHQGRGVARSDAEAVRHYKLAAEQGHALALNNLGLKYKSGRGVAQSDENSAACFLKAAEQGHAGAQNNLGVMYKQGRGVKRNDEQAVFWYTRAAEQGDADAQNSLGVMYQEGKGCAQSFEEAVKWYLKAAEQGHALAQNNLALKYDKGRGVEQSDEQAVFWYKKSSDKGNANAQNNLGLKYKNGRGVAQSNEEAVRLYRVAAEQGHPGAQNNLGAMHKQGLGVAQSDEEAVRWFRTAASLGHAGAQNNLALMYKCGRGVPTSDEQAVYWYQKAAEQGDPFSQFSLGVLCENGKGCPKDLEMALKLYSRAATQGHSGAQAHAARLREAVLFL